MKAQSRNPWTLALGNLAAFLAFSWAAIGLYTSFFRGTVPCIPWHTSHTIIFGFVWLSFVFPGALYQARTIRNCFLSVAIWNYGWSLLPFALANLVIQLLGMLVIPIAWFPSQLPSPLGNIEGGVVTGIVTLVLVLLVLAPCNFSLAAYMEWRFCKQNVEYLQMVEEDGERAA